MVSEERRELLIPGKKNLMNYTFAWWDDNIVLCGIAVLTDSRAKS